MLISPGCSAELSISGHAGIYQSQRIGTTIRINWKRSRRRNPNL